MGGYSHPAVPSVVVLDAGDPKRLGGTRLCEWFRVWCRRTLRRTLGRPLWGRRNGRKTSDVDRHYGRMGVSLQPAWYQWLNGGCVVSHPARDFVLPWLRRPAAVRDPSDKPN